MNESDLPVKFTLNQPPTGTPLVQQVIDVRQWERHEPTYRFDGLSRHGYVLQCTLAGECWHVSGGRGYKVSRGSVVWLDNVEEHTCEVRKAPWVFCSIQFLAPTLPPPTFDYGNWRGGSRIIKQFLHLLDLWNDPQINAYVRSLRVQAGVASLLADIMTMTTGRPIQIDETTQPWWELETAIRKRLDQPIYLATLEEWSNMNRMKLSAICRRATNMSPMKRVKYLRLNHAASVLISSKMMIQEIAYTVGYSRGHEFSRDFRQMFGMSPKMYREQAAKDVQHILKKTSNQK